MNQTEEKKKIMNSGGRYFALEQPKIQPRYFNPLIERQLNALSPQKKVKSLLNKKNFAKKPPPILLPFTQTTGASSKVEASLPPRTIAYKAGEIQYKPIFHPLTPHVHALQDIIPLISRCENNNDNITYRIIPRQENFENKSNSNIDKKRETLTNICKLVSDPIFRHTLNIETYNNIIELAKSHIFRPSEKYPLVNEYGEGDNKYDIENWEHLDLCHKILRSLMLDHNSFTGFLTKKLCKSLVDSLNTPVQEELKAFEETIKIILDNYIGQRNHILKYMTENVIAYNDTLEGTDQIAPLLRLFYRYYTSLEPPLKQNAFMTFRTVFFPLISTPYAYEFEKPICELSLFFEVQDPATTFWCLKYMTNHWPVQNTKKIALFLHHMTDFLPYLPESLLSQAVPMVARNFAAVIGSPHVKTSIEAILYCDNFDFLNVFQNMPEVYSKYFIPAVDEACKSWKNDAQSIAQSLRSKLSQYDHSVKKEEKYNSSAIWKQIKSSTSL